MRNEFEEWSNKADAIINLAEKGKIGYAILLQHCKQYKLKWNRGL